MTELQEGTAKPTAEGKVVDGYSHKAQQMLHEQQQCVTCGLVPVLLLLGVGKGCQHVG